MLDFPRGLTPDGLALIKDLQRHFAEEDLRKNGGYLPPDSDPRKCEPAQPASPEDKGGFDYRLEQRALEPFDRCGRIHCRVREQCTALVSEALSQSH